MLAEERHYRGWPGTIMLRLSGDIGPERLAGLYRSLRKSFEDSKNEAGAGDFYYGEMEMRRRSPATRLAERWILTLYWLLSGYGQRAARALVALLALIVVVTVLLWQWDRASGRRHGVDRGREWTVLVARFLGPVLLALAVLAVRARVKR